MSSVFKKLTTAIVLLLVLSAFLAACAPKPATVAPTSGEGASEVPKPSNAGGPGEAVNLTGNATAGADVYTKNCTSCHGAEGKTGIANPGSDDGTVPVLNPIDPGLKSADAKTFATNIDLFVEHGSTPAGSNPAKLMTAFGDQKTLTPQQIADVIAYVISLNK